MFQSEAWLVFWRRTGEGWIVEGTGSSPLHVVIIRSKTRSNACVAIERSRSITNVY